MASWLRSHDLCFVSEVYWNIAMPIHSCWGCLCFAGRANLGVTRGLPPTLGKCLYDPVASIFEVVKAEELRASIVLEVDFLVSYCRCES